MSPLANLETLFSRVADEGLAGGACPEAVSALQFAAGAVRDERHRVDAETDQIIGALRDRVDDKLCLDAADWIESAASSSSVIGEPKP